MDLLLSYERDGDHYNATFHLEDAEEPRTYLDSLAGVTWPLLLRGVSRHLAKYPDTGLVVSRSDHTLAIPYRASQEEVDAFRRDPVDAIRMWTYEPKMEVRPSFMQPIQAGFSTVAASLGDRIHVRRNAILRKVQSPFTSDWVHLEELVLHDGPWVIPVTVPHVQWAGMSLPELLATNCPSFYLPALGYAGGWIVHEKLQWRYDTFVAERYDVK